MTRPAAPASCPRYSPEIWAWGVAGKFHEATGLWPAFDGNALDWNDTAPNHGWTVVLDAEPRAVVVFEPGVQGADATYGDVAWVDAVDYRPDGRWIGITEMNAIGVGQWSQRTIKDVGRDELHSRALITTPLRESPRPALVVGSRRRRSSR
jgi:hypothetical protein